MCNDLHVTGIWYILVYLHLSAAFVTKQKSLGWSKTSKRKLTFDFVESIGRKDELNIHR